MNLLTGVSAAPGAGRLWRSQAWSQPDVVSGTGHSKPWLQSSTAVAAPSGYWATINSNYLPYQGDLDSPDSFKEFSLSPPARTQQDSGGFFHQQTDAVENTARRDLILPDNGRPAVTSDDDVYVKVSVVLGDRCVQHSRRLSPVGVL